MQIEQEAIKTCPLCKGAAILNKDSILGWWEIKCTNCGLTLSRPPRGIKKLIYRWNTR